MKSRAVPYSVQALYVYEWSFWTSKEMYTTINIKTTSSQSNVVQFSSSEFSSFRAKWLTLRRARRRSPTLSRPHSTTPTSSRGSSPTRPTRAISWSYYCGKLNGKVARHADILATILARMSARMSVSCNTGFSRFSVGSIESSRGQLTARIKGINDGSPAVRTTYELRSPSISCSSSCGTDEANSCSELSTKVIANKGSCIWGLGCRDGLTCRIFPSTVLLYGSGDTDCFKVLHPGDANFSPFWSVVS